MTFCTITEIFYGPVLLQGFIHDLLFCYREFEMSLYDYRDSSLTFCIFAKILKWNCTITGIHIQISKSGLVFTSKYCFLLSLVIWCITGAKWASKLWLFNFFKKILYELGWFPERHTNYIWPRTITQIYNWLCRMTDIHLWHCTTNEILSWLCAITEIHNDLIRLPWFIYEFVW